MDQPEESSLANYPIGRGYGNDYMRGGEVLGGYGYAERAEYSKARGEINGQFAADSSEGQSPDDIRT